MSGDRWRADDRARPVYLETDRPVEIGDRGACPVVGGVGGLVIGLNANDNGLGILVGWNARLRYPNYRVEVHDAERLYWVEPHRCLDVYLLDEDVEAIRSGSGDIVPADIEQRMVDAILASIKALDDE